MADHPDFPAIAKHLQVLKPFGSGLTVEYLNQAIRYALELEQELAGVHQERGVAPNHRPAAPPRPVRR